MMGLHNIKSQTTISVLLLLASVGCTKVNFVPTYPISPEIATDVIPELPPVVIGKVTETFTQGYFNNKVDILIIDDNSGSMVSKQTELGKKMNNFLSTLFDVDWQVGITTTDVSDGPWGIQGDLLNFKGTQSNRLTKDVPDYLTVFSNTIVREETSNCAAYLASGGSANVAGACPSGDEQPMYASILAMEKRDTSNKGFFRDGADLAILTISDEDEMSDGRSSKATTPEAVLNKAKSIWGDKKRVLGYGMVIIPGDVDCYKKALGSYGTFVAHLADISGGLVGSICDDDYSTSLAVLGKHLRMLSDYVSLRADPEVDTIEVYFKPEHKTKWHVEGRRIYFEDPPSKGTEIRVDYAEYKEEKDKDKDKDKDDGKKKK